VCKLVCEDCGKVERLHLIDATGNGRDVRAELVATADVVVVVVVVAGGGAAPLRVDCALQPCTFRYLGK
jgi:hypothetical protein